MASDETDSGPSAVKLGGIALIGVGALAGAFGVVTAVSPPQRPEAQQVPSSPPAQERSTHPPKPGGHDSAPDMSDSPDTPNPPDTSTANPGSTSNPGSTRNPGSTSEAPQPPPETTRNPRQQDIVVRVYNNSKIKGLAHDVAEDFRRAGYEVPEVGNYSGRIYTTTVYFRPGTAEEAQAREIADRFGARLEPRFEGIAKASPGVIAIVTKDYSGLRDGK